MKRKYTVVNFVFHSIHYRFFSVKILPFSKIPSPKSYPIIGHAHLFFKNGMYHKEKFAEAVQDLSLKYGPIFYLKFLGQKMVLTIDAENACKLFDAEGKYPFRINMPALAHYQQNNFNCLGIVVANGVYWNKLRKYVNPLLNKSYISSFSSKNYDIAQAFVSYVKKRRNEDNMLLDVCSHVYRYSTECISIVSPGRRLFCLENYNNAKINEILHGSSKFMDGLYASFSEPPLWKFIKTKAYENLQNGFNIIKNYIDTELESENKLENTFIKSLFKNSNLSYNEARLLAADIFSGGIDAVATTLTMTLYHLSRNKKCQYTAFEDIKNNSVLYLRACVKETLRLCPTSGGTTRSLPKNIIMNNYLIPAGTTVTIVHPVISQMEKYFDDAHLYKPERWLHSSKHNKKNEFTSYASLPFGYGPRVCPGRWLTEQECVIFLSEILKEFILEYPSNSEIGMVYRMNRIPDQLVNIKFIDRST